jgi:dinuclear metal center YbgI/SA1388 family protein
MHLAESWDNPGLQVGNLNWPVTKIMVALDPTQPVIARAAELSADMLITHHPLIFRPLKSVDLSTPIGEVINRAIGNRIAIFSIHTNFDSAVNGLNDILADGLGLKNIHVLAPYGKSAPGDSEETSRSGLGRIGDLPAPVRLQTLCNKLKSALHIETIRCVGDVNRTVHRAAICTGSGSSLLDRFWSSDADVFVTGDLRYHDARDAEDRNAALIDIGHFGSEVIMVEHLGARLRQILGEQHPEIEVMESDVEKDPFTVI